MRILFVNRMASMVRGGGETFDLEIARHLAGLGCDITFLTGIPLFGKALLGPDEWFGNSFQLSTSNVQHPITDEDKLLHSSFQNPSSFARELRRDKKSIIQNITIRSPYTGWFPWDKTPGGWRLRVADFKMFEYLAARWAYNHREQFDVVQVCELPFFVHFLKSQIANRKSNIPIVMRLTAPDFYDPVDGLTKADAVIASGDTMRRVREKLRPDCHDIPNGVDVERFRVSGFRFQEKAGDRRPQTSEFRQNNKIPPTDIVITHVARFQSVKNHAMLIDAFAILLKTVPNAWLVLAGSGPLRGEIEERCREVGMENNVIFLGEVRHADLPAIYDASDINVMPSDYESFCFAVLEGMASGLPHVVTDTNWVPGLLGGNIQHSTFNKQQSTSSVSYQSKIRTVPGGLVTPIGDAATFAEALLMLARDAGLRRSMGSWNRDRVVRDFTWDASARKLVDVYRNLVY